MKSFHVFTARLIQTETKTTTTCCLFGCLNGSDGLSLKQGNGPNPSKPTKANAKHSRVCLPPVYSCTGTEETSMVHLFFPSSVKGFIGLIPSCNSQLRKPPYARHRYAFLRGCLRKLPPPSITAYAASRAVLLLYKLLHRQKNQKNATQRTCGDPRTRGPSQDYCFFDAVPFLLILIFFF